MFREILRVALGGFLGSFFSAKAGSSEHGSESSYGSDYTESTTSGASWKGLGSWTSSWMRSNER